MSGRSKNDVAWDILFERHGILDGIEASGSYQISASTINELREARLMTKFDHRIQLPSIFKQNNLTIQPITRGTYLIGRFDSYFQLPVQDEVEIEEISFPAGLETINPQDLYSESMALMCAQNSGVLEQLLDEPVSLTVFGRMSVGKFDYFIRDIRSDRPVEIRVENSQCEIDGGFEGATLFAIVEAKNETIDDFLIRQLYYPYRLWSEKTRKDVVPMLMTFSNDVFSFYLFRFVDRMHYNSIEMIGQRKFQVGTSEIELADIIEALGRIQIRPEPEGVPFPQADSFVRIIDLLSQLHSSGDLTREEITTNHAFDVRQTQYYTNAGRYLGLIRRTQGGPDGVSYSLTRRGSEILGLRPVSRNLALAEGIIEHRVFNETLRLYIDQVARPTIDQVIQIMRAAELGLDLEGNTTIARRARTVLGWIDWIVRLTRR